MSKDNETWWIFDEAVPVGKKLKAENVVVDPTTNKKYMVYDGEPKDMIKFMSSIENVKDKGHWASPGNFTKDSEALELTKLIKNTEAKPAAPKPGTTSNKKSLANELKEARKRLKPISKPEASKPSNAPKRNAPKPPAPKGAPTPKPSAKQKVALKVVTAKKMTAPIKHTATEIKLNKAQVGQGRKMKRVSKYKWKRKKINKK
jgi:hypothetical protein